MTCSLHHPKYLQHPITAFTNAMTCSLHQHNDLHPSPTQWPPAFPKQGKVLHSNPQFPSGRTKYSSRVCRGKWWRRIEESRLTICWKVAHSFFRRHGRMNNSVDKLVSLFSAPSKWPWPLTVKSDLTVDSEIGPWDPKLNKVIYLQCMCVLAAKLLHEKYLN